MDIQCAPAAFSIRLSEKRETENETEYMLPEYLPNIRSLIKTDARLKITDKTVSESGVGITGTVIYSVLYRSDHGGALKCAVFTDDFNIGFDFPENVEPTLVREHVLCFPCIGHVNAKMQSQRRIAAKCRFSVTCEVLETSLSDPVADEQNDASESTHCSLQLQKKNLQSGRIHFSEEYRHTFSEELSLEEGMPEISEVLCADARICIKESKIDDIKAEISGELLFSCLYEAKNDEESEYICFTKGIPFRAEPDFDFPCDGQKVTAKGELVSLTVEPVSDAYGEHSKLSVGGEIRLSMLGFDNQSISIVTDLYSTECETVPQKKAIRNLSFIDIYTGALYSEEALRTELHGIADLISSSVSVCFGNPEFLDGKVFLPANGNLSLLGIKENGDVESIKIPLHLKIASHDIPFSLSSDKIKWFNFTGLCSHECEIAGGELHLKLWVKENIGAFRDETITLICGYEEKAADNTVGTSAGTSDGGSASLCGFTLYFPDEGESVWDVSKAHAVSVEKVRAENNLTSDLFDGKKIILLH